MTALDSTREALTREVGPLPVWGWVVAGVGGAGLGLLITRSFGSSSGPGGPAPSGGSAVGGSGSAPMFGAGSGYVGGSVGLPSAAGYATDPAADGYGSNNEWRAAALDRLVASGNYAAYEVNEALGRFLGSRQLTPDQQAIIEEALQTIGGPPVPPMLAPDEIPAPTYAPSESPSQPAPTPAPAPAAPAPSPSAPPAAAADRPFPERRSAIVSHRVRSGDTWQRLDFLAGVRSGTTKQLNEYLKQPGQVIPLEPRPGSTVLIPPSR